MRQRHARARFGLAGLLALALVAITALPASATEPHRRGGAEDLAFRLVNCMRTGGHVTSYGTCRGWGSGRHSAYVPPLKRSARISNRVAWPWARKSVQFYGTRSCWIGHARAGSTVQSRFAAASLGGVANGENMGCGLYGSAKKTVVRIVRMWQAEKSYRGPHWRQVKDRDFKSAGVGVAMYGSRKSQLVVDFYGKVID